MSVVSAVSLQPVARAGERSDTRLILALLLAWAVVGIVLTLSVASAFGPEVIAALASG
jgi:uncharacterized membrane protein